MDIREKFKGTLLEFGYEAECREELTAVLEATLSDGEAKNALEGYVQSYRDGALDWEGLTATADAVAERLSLHSFAVRLVFYIALVPYALPYFESRGLGREEWYDSMIDLRWKARETKDVHGLWGTHTNWFKAFYTAERVAFGRLQFNPVKADFDHEGNGFSVKQGDTVITIHIPSDTRTPFSRENRLAAYERARKHFAPMFQGGPVIFRCGSWLLHPAHRQILPEGSNVRDFLDDFETVEGSFKPTDGNLWRIFNIPEYNGDPDSLPESTGMMRAYKKFLKDGGVPGTMVGYRI